MPFFYLILKSMHIFFSGIGGTAIGPLAIIAKQAGYTVSGSDKQDSQYITYLKKQGIKDIHIGQTYEQLAEVHKKNPVEWYVYSSAVAMENPKSPEFKFCNDQGIRMSKRDELLNQILDEKQLKLIAIAGTHGKTTTTAMVIWLFQELGLPLSHSVGAKIGFSEMGKFDPGSEFFAYEADEFARNFLAFDPHLSLITGVTWDHHEIFPTREDYQEAFREFIGQSRRTIIWQEDSNYLNLKANSHYTVLDSSNPKIHTILLPGFYNRLNAWIVIQGVHELTKEPIDKLIGYINNFPGLQRRMELIAPNIYSDYAHTPEKIRGAMSVALELAEAKGQDVVAVYEPLTNRRQHFMLRYYKDCFNGVKKVYWIPSYLAREDPDQRVIPPSELIKELSDPSIAEAYGRDGKLAEVIKKHADAGDMVVCIAGGGGDSLDEWVREKFKAKT